MRTVRQTNYFTLVSLIGQLRNGLCAKWVVLDYYRDFCENRKIYCLEDDFEQAIANENEEEMAKWLRTNVEYATSYYD